MKGHPRAGEATEFKEKLLSGKKIHTIRSNAEYWKKIISEVNAGKAYLSIREWEGMPYKSGQVEIMQVHKLGFEDVEIRCDGQNIGIDISGKEANVMNIINVAHNDGLDIVDFSAWFTGKEPFRGIIIHFTDFRYNEVA